MCDVQDQRRNVRVEDGIDSSWCSVRRNAGSPILPVLVRQVGIDQLQRLSKTVMFLVPNPAPIAQLIQTALPDGPVAFVGILDAVHSVTGRIVQVDVVAGLAEHALIIGDGAPEHVRHTKGDPIPDHIRHAGIFVGEGLAMRGHDQIVAGPDNRVAGKGERHATAEPPATEIHIGGGVVITQCIPPGGLPTRDGT